MLPGYCPLSCITAECSFEHLLQRVLLTVLCTAATVITLCFLVSLLPVQIPTPGELARIVYVPLADVKPEPLERRMFLLSVLMLPGALFCWDRFWRRILERWTAERVHRLVVWTVAGSICALIMHLWGACDEWAYFVRGKSAGAVWLAAVSLTAGGICLQVVRRNRRALGLVDATLSVVVALLLALIFLYGLSDLSTVDDSYVFTNHFNVIFHSVVQVFQGKELLADFIHQYGLYPHFLEPLLKVTGLGVFTFSTVMGGMTLLSFYFLLRTLLAATALRTVALLGFLAAVTFCYVFKAMAAYDPYFQYFPLRSFFPALAAWLMTGYVTSRTTQRFAALYVVAGCAVLWNPESGIVVLVAVLLTTLYDAYPRVGLRGSLIAAGTGTGIAAAVIALFSGYLFVRYGFFPDYAELIRFIRLFYVTGYFMLPMPVFHPWNLVALIYIAGLGWGIGALADGRVTHRTTIVTFLSLLGIGLFTYYQGRSHNEVFPLCIYPAFMVTAIFIDRLLERGSENRIALRVGLCGIVLLSFIAGGLYKGGLSLIYGPFGVATRYNTYRRTEPSELMKRVEFVRRNTGKGEQVLILSTHSGIYHLASQTTNPVRIPSILEVVLTEDYRRILQHLEDASCRKLFVDGWLLSEDEPVKELRTLLGGRYVPVSMTPDLRLIMYSRVR